MTKSKILILICALCFILMMAQLNVVASTPPAVQPQTVEPEWSEPWNLSQSGAASQPVIIPGAEGVVQAFWWDQFDGVATSIFADESWSAPALALMAQTVLQGQGINAEFVSVPVAEMPVIAGDNAGYAHAFWLGVEDEETELRPLLANRLVISTTQWTDPIQVAESALVWDMTAGPDGNLHLVYIRATHTETDPASLVYRQSTDSGQTWSPPVVLHSSIYFRLLEAEAAHLEIIADELGNVLVTSQALRPSQPFFVRSADGGSTWDAPVFIGTADLPATGAYFVLPGVAPAAESTAAEVIILWQVGDSASACTLVQQRSRDGGATWSEPVRVLEDLRACPEAPVLLPLAPGGVLLLYGENSAALNLAVWDPASDQWSEVQPLNLEVETSDTDTPVVLADLEVHLLEGWLTVTGTGQDGEIWVLRSDLDLFSWAFAPPSPWSEPVRIAESLGLPGLPSVAVDSEDRVHVLWSDAPSAAQPGTTLLYTRWDGARWSIPIIVYQTSAGKADQPVLAVVGDRLHAVWSSGLEGQILYSRAYASDAHTSGGWSEVQQLGDFTSSSAPDIAADLLGRLVVAFAVPVNEDRGIYLARSADGGEMWTDPVQVVDTVAQGWLRADHPSLAVDERGIIHTIWVQAPLPGNGVPEAVYYARSIDNGEIWSEPFLLAEGPFDEPRLGPTLHGQLLAFWRDLRQNVIRYRLTADGGETWDTVSTIPGFRGMTGPVGFCVDGSGAVHAVAVAHVGGISSLDYAVWDGSRWQLAPPWTASEEFITPAGVALAVRGAAGQLDIVLPASASGDGVWHLTRVIDPVVAEPISLITPEPTPTLTPSPTRTPAPTPRPTVAPDASAPGMPTLEIGPLSQPLSALWGIGLALLAVAALILRQVTKHR